MRHGVESLAEIHCVHLFVRVIVTQQVVSDDGLAVSHMKSLIENHDSEMSGPGACQDGSAYDDI